MSGSKPLGEGDDRGRPGEIGKDVGVTLVHMGHLFWCWACRCRWRTGGVDAGGALGVLEACYLTPLMLLAQVETCWESVHWFCVHVPSRHQATPHHCRPGPRPHQGCGSAWGGPLHTTAQPPAVGPRPPSPGVCPPQLR